MYRTARVSRPLCRTPLSKAASLLRCFALFAPPIADRRSPITLRLSLQLALNIPSAIGEPEVRPLWQMLRCASAPIAIPGRPDTPTSLPSCPACSTCSTTFCGCLFVFHASSKAALDLTISSYLRCTSLIRLQPLSEVSCQSCSPPSSSARVTT